MPKPCEIELYTIEHREVVYERLISRYRESRQHYYETPVAVKHVSWYFHFNLL